MNRNSHNPTALITEIERFSVHDGPGIRTVVFLKGCPLRCAWCHNPECISFEKQTLYYEEKCIGCGKCMHGCYSGARTECGREMSVSEVMADILADKLYYRTSGGVTLSGGEPLAHREFALALIKACREEKIHTGIETSLYRFDHNLLSSCDLIMADLKIFDDALHKKWTGIGNDEIKKNLKRADALNLPIIVRTPILPGINNTEENIRKTAGFLRELKNIQAYELLPYHPLGLSKAAALGLEMQKFPIPTSQEMEELKRYAELS